MSTYITLETTEIITMSSTTEGEPSPPQENRGDSEEPIENPPPSTPPQSETAEAENVSSNGENGNVNPDVSGSESGGNENESQRQTQTEYSGYDDDDDDVDSNNSFFGNDFEIMPIMNKLYDVLRDVIVEGFDGIHLPSLVAIGDQSQGKTSVLEGIVKRQFLPKGDQIQTRCPIEIQLVHISKDIDTGYAEVLNEDGKTWIFLRNMGHVRKLIQERTDNIKANYPGGVSDKRIVVKIYSPDVPDLTLVDLPGFLNVSTEGQTEDITQKIKDVVRKEISNPNCIILAVTAAGNNIGTSKALKEALIADPNRERTLGIITKLDLMDKGTNCEDVLRGNQYKLQLGFVGVMCRNFQDNANNKSIDEKISEEKKFLEMNYPSIANRNGIPYLTKTISQLLLQRIYQNLPGVRVNIEKLIQAYKCRLASFGTVIEPHERRKLLVKCLHKFRDSFKAQIDGTKRDIPTDKLAACAKIMGIFKGFMQGMQFDLMTGITDEDIDRCIKNSHALHNIDPLSLDDAFQKFARDEVGKLRAPVIDCAQQVNAVMVNAIKESCVHEAEKYPKLNNFIALVASDVINECFEKCKDYLEKFMDAEETLVFSSDPNFQQQLMRDDNNNQGAQDGVEPNTDPAVIKERGKVRRMVRNYFGIVQSRVKDHCPKAISNMLVYEVVKQLGEALVLRLDTPEHADDLMKESASVQRDRAAIRERLEKFMNAKEIINEVLRAVAV